MRIAVVGKGGSGKSVLAGTLARLLARQGDRVLALDSDLMPGLAFSLGAEQPGSPPLLEAAERGENGRWRLKRGIGPVRAVRRYSTDAPDGIRLLQAGKLGEGGIQEIQPAVQAYYRVVHRLGDAPAFADWSMVADLPAGPRQVAFDWAPFADTYVVVAEPTAQSLLTARRVTRMARTRERRIVTVANKVRSPADVRRIEAFLGTTVSAAVPADADVRAAERRGVAPLEHAPASAAVGEITRLLDHLARVGA